MNRVEIERAGTLAGQIAACRDGVAQPAPGQATNDEPAIQLDAYPSVRAL